MLAKREGSSTANLCAKQLNGGRLSFGRIVIVAPATLGRAARRKRRRRRLVVVVAHAQLACAPARASTRTSNDSARQTHHKTRRNCILCAVKYESKTTIETTTTLRRSRAARRGRRARTSSRCPQRRHRRPLSRQDNSQNKTRLRCKQTVVVGVAVDVLVTHAEPRLQRRLHRRANLIRLHREESNLRDRRWR